MKSVGSVSFGSVCCCDCSLTILVFDTATVRVTVFVSGYAIFLASATTMLLFMHLYGLLVREVAALRFDDVIDTNRTMLEEMILDAARTKSKRACKIFLSKQMQPQLQTYVSSVSKNPQHGYLSATQKSARFIANTAKRHLQRLKD